jgi:uncharacterized protein (TIGR02001 family)
MQVKTISILGAAAGLLLAGNVAQAQFSSTITAVNDYDFRGVSLSAKDPALQASLDYAFENGLAIGAWASNIDSGDEVDDDLELDLYFNYAYELSESSAFTAGLTYYLYPSGDTTEDYPEIYVGFNYGDLAVKQWYTNDNFGSDESALYTEGNYTLSLNDTWALTAHLGYSWGSFWEDLDLELFDYSVGATAALGKFTLAAKIAGTDASGAQKVEDDVFNNEPRLVFSIATTLPWSNE